MYGACQYMVFQKSTVYRAGIGFYDCFAVNADTLRMVDQMNNDEKLRKELVQSASEYVKTIRRETAVLPMIL
ncbi:hypothetical protein EJ377_14250 [Chryseobacterium arthrosphaerae]|uniref:Uncharacterized protein n=1 Tax=Chryseobacterium arthrosphaerae TaxID=651561 RepID=A0A432DS41_9FLAO|nr:hypothetical protein EJ377_14250 [Chryseobacterium arthrosphaerae]